MTEHTHRIALIPGSMGVCALALDLFGLGRVEPGSWATPVWVRDLDSEEVAFATEFFSEVGVEVRPA